MVFHSGRFGGGPGEDVGDEAHGVRDGIDVGAAGDVLLEDVVLDGAGEFCGVCAGAFGDGDVEREQDAGGGVDGHGGGDGLVETGCRRRGAACPRWNRWRRRLCRPRPGPRASRSRSRSGWAGRRPLRGRRSRWRGGICSGGWTLRHRPCRRTGAWSRGGRGTWWAGCRGCRGIRRGGAGWAVSFPPIAKGKGRDGWGTRAVSFPCLRIETWGTRALSMPCFRIETWGTRAAEVKQA
jgi:hypothetical protein